MNTNLNHAIASNGSSFLDENKKMLKLKDQNLFILNTHNNIINNNNHFIPSQSIANTNTYANLNNENLINNYLLINDMNSHNEAGGEKSLLSSNQNLNSSHADSLDFNSNQPQYKLNNVNINQNFFPQKFVANSNASNINTLSGPFNQAEVEFPELLGNTPNNLQNQYSTYNFCYEDNYFCKNNNVPYIDYKCQQSTSRKSHCKISYSDTESILENLLVLIKDQNGCRIIQKKLEERNPKFFRVFFEKVKNKFHQNCYYLYSSV